MRVILRIKLLFTRRSDYLVLLKCQHVANLRVFEREFLSYLKKIEESFKRQLIADEEFVAAVVFDLFVLTSVVSFSYLSSLR